MSIASRLSNEYNSKLDTYGTNFMVWTASGTEDEDYGEDTITYIGSYYQRGMLQELKADERQYLPEGQRTDELMNIYLKTSGTVLVGDKITISGTSVSYEVQSILDDRLLGDTKVYKRARVKKI